MTPGPAASGADGGAPAKTALVAIALAAAVVLAMWPVLHARAIGLDDPSLVVHNALVSHPGFASLRRFWSEVLAPSTLSAYYMPLSMTSLMLDAAAGGSATNLLPFHVTSLALHVLSTLMLYLLLRRLTGSSPAAAAAALIWGLNPVMVESVASAGERKTVLASALAFASAWSYVRAAQTGERAARAGAVALFALALLAKPSALALPAALAVFDRWPLRRTLRASLAQLWPFALIAAVSAAIAALSVRATWEFAEPPPLDVLQLALKAVWLPAFYLGQLLWPARLSTVYAPPDPFTLANPAVLVGVAATLALAVAAALMLRRAPGLAAGLAVYALLLAPTFGILRFSPVIAYDRYLHLPGMGLAFALAAGLVALARTAKRPGARAALTAAVLAIAVAETMATRATLRPWSDSVALWQRAVEVSPRAGAAHNGLGATWSEAGDPARAIAEFEAAIRVEPDYNDAHLNLGRELMHQGRAADALPHLVYGAAHAPGSPAAALQLGLALQALGHAPEAERQFRRALALRADFTLALAPLGMVRLQQGDTAEGLRLLHEAVSRTEDPGARLALAGALQETGGPDAEVARLLSDALRARADLVPALNGLAWLRATAREPAERDTAQALRLSARAVEITQGSDPSVLDTRAASLAAAGRFTQAAAIAERALGLARATGDDSLAAGVARRLVGYRQGRRYVQVEPREPPRH